MNLRRTSSGTILPKLQGQTIQNFIHPHSAPSNSILTNGKKASTLPNVNGKVSNRILETRKHEYDETTVERIITPQDLLCIADGNSWDPSLCKTLVVGKQVSSIITYLKQLHFGVTNVGEYEEAESILQRDRSQRDQGQDLGYSVVLIYINKLPDDITIPFVAQLHHSDPLLSIFVLPKEWQSPECTQSCLDAGAVDVIPASISLEALNHCLKTVWHLYRIKKQLHSIATRGRHEHLSNGSTRAPTPPQATNAITTSASTPDLELENSALKLEIAKLKKNLANLNASKMADRWKLAALKGTMNKQSEQKQKSEATLKTMWEEVKGLPTPMQKVSRTVGRLSTVSSLLDPADLKNVLTNVVQELSNQNLHAPDLQILQKMDMDDMTKNFIVSSFTDQFRGQMHAKDAKLRKSKSVHDINSERLIIDEIRNSKPVELVFKEMVDLVIIMFDNLGLIAEFEVPIKKLRNWVNNLQKNYQNNPYHNWRHAFDVTQMCYMFITTSRVGEILTRQDELVLLVAALSHDVGHPGLTNAFQINAQTELALTYNDSSVLENYHASNTFKLLKEDENNFLINLSSAEFMKIRKELIASILATDMSTHFELTSKLVTLLEAQNSLKEVQERQLLMNILLHSADLSNMVRKKKIARKWSDLVFEEILLQGDVEKEKNLPVSPYMNREDTDQTKMSINFIDYVVLPLYTALSKIFPELQHCQESLQVTREMWQKHGTDWPEE